jgi:tetratricopeptide (TPR) repeat protein
MARSKRSTPSEFLWLAAGAVLAVLVYAQTLDGPFVFDDEPNITANRHIRISALAAPELCAAAFQSPLPNRPLANASFAINYLWGGYNPLGYRLINLLIHIGNGFLIYGLARAMLSAPALAAVGQAGRAGACLAAALWLLHPLHTQSVAYIVQRMTAMAAFFYLLAMLGYARGRLAVSPRAKAAWFSACLGSGLLALATKEIAATLPVFIFLYEWFFFQKAEMKWLRGKLPVLAAAGAAVTGIGLIYLGGPQALERVLEPYAAGGLTAGQRVLTQARVVVFYISLLLWPNPGRLNLDHDFPVSRTLFDPATTALALIFLLVLLSAAVLTARRHALGSYAVLWFLGNLVIESSIIRLELVFEHRTYLPSVLPAIALAVLAAHKVPWKKAAAALGIAVAFLWAGWTYQRNHVWTDDTRLWEDCLRKSPEKARPYSNLGSALVQKGRFEEALPHFEKAIQIRRDYGDALYNMGYALLRLDRIDEGIGYLEKTLDIEPGNYMAHNNLGVACMMKKEYPRAVLHFEEALRLKPEQEATHSNLGVALRNQGRFEDAESHFRAAIRINPAYAEAYNNLGVTLREMGRLAEAAGSFRQALRLQPDYVTARRNLDDTEALIAKPRS